MKKISYLIALFVACSSIASATNHQGNWRWRNDDGSETTATWKAAENSLTNIQSPANARLRIQIFMLDASDATWYSSSYNLAYKKSGDTEWSIITNDPSTNHFVLSPSPNFADGAATTLQMTPQDVGYTYIPGYMIESSFPVVRPDMPHLTSTEWEYCIKPTANILRDSYYFQVQDMGGSGIAFGAGLIGCDVSITVPSVSTIQMTTILNNTAQCLGTITDDGSLELIQRGACWNTTGTPTLADGHSTENGSFATGNFSAPLSSLSPNTTYYVRLYAMNTIGTGYSNELVFTTIPTLGEWGLIAFAGLIALFGATAIVKRLV